MSIRKREVEIGDTLYPGPSAGDGKSVVDRFNGKVDGWQCKQCGFWCTAQRVTAPGTLNEGDGFVRVVSNDPVVDQGGCPFCGTPNSQ